MTITNNGGDGLLYAVTMGLAALVLVTTVHVSRARAGETPVYDANGHYAGSVHDYGKTQTFTEPQRPLHRQCHQPWQRHDDVLRPRRADHRVSRVVDRPGVQLQREMT